MSGVTLLQRWSGRLPVRAALAVLLVSLLVGCAGQPGAADNGQRIDYLTQPEESEARKRARVRLQLAAGYFDQGQTNVALEELRQTLTIDPTLPDAFNLRGLIYLRLNELGLAEDSFKRALVLNPREPNTQHNYGWMLCQQGRYTEAGQMFTQALAHPIYMDKAKTYMTQGMCQQRAGQLAEAERSLSRSYELDPGNPITGYNLAQILYDRGELPRAQFYVRRINNSDLANAESLWLGIKLERRLDNRDAFSRLSDDLRKRFPQSREYLALERRAFDE